VLFAVAELLVLIVLIFLLLQAAALTAELSILWVFYDIFLIFGSISTGSLLQHAHHRMCYFHTTNQLQLQIWSTQNDHSCHKTRF